MRMVLWGLVAVLCSCPRLGSGQRELSERVAVKADPTADTALSAALDPSRNRKDTVAALLEVRRNFPESTAGQEALYRAGLLAYEEGDYAVARRALGELAYENPLFANINTVRLKMALSALQLRSYHDAYQTLSTLVERLSGLERKEAEDALALAAAGSQQFQESLKLAIRKVENADNVDVAKTALIELEEVVDTRTTHVAIAEALSDMPSTHPAWPLLTFKLARVYFHLRDWQHLDETLKRLEDAPPSSFAPDIAALRARINRRTNVKPRAVGVVLPLSGKYKPFGDAALRGIGLAFKGSSIELIVKDTQGDPTLTAQIIDSLAFDDGVIAVIGPLLTDDARRAALAAEEIQLPLITLSRAEGITGIGSNIFRTMMTNSQQAEALAEYTTQTLGLKTVAMLYPNTPFGVELSNAFWTAIEKRGGEIRGVESYDHDQKTFTEEAKRLVGKYYLEDRSDYHEKVRELRDKNLDEFRKRKALEKLKSTLEPIVDFEALLIPDSWQQVSLIAPALAVEDIITNACDKHDFERIQKTTGKDNLKTVTLLGPSTWSSPIGTSGDPQLIERGGKYIQCSIYVDAFYENSERAQTKNFVQLFRQVHGETGITILDAIGYDTAAMVRTIIEKTQPVTRQDFRDRLATTKDFQGVTGALTFDADRQARRPMFFLNITPKGVKEISATARPEG